MKILIVVGARPNYMKAAPLVRALEGTRHLATLLHTGQHSDDNMSKVFFDELGLPAPAAHLGVTKGTHAEQTAAVMVGFEKHILGDRPDLVVVVGDINSTVAVALVCAKDRVSVAHLEAGLRSGDWSMPEEINRVVTDRLSELLFTHCADADENLRREGIPEERIRRVGNIMIDSLVDNLPRTEGSRVLADLDLEGKEYALLTLHRPSNVDDKKTLLGIMGAVHDLAESIPVVFSCHPRTANRLDTAGHGGIQGQGNLVRLAPLGYLDFLSLLKGSRLVLTDSGGLQEETTYLQIPCLTIRTNTERPITIREGTNMLVGPDPERILQAARSVLRGGTQSGTVRRHRVPDLWDGKTAGRIVRVLESFEGG